MPLADGNARLVQLGHIEGLLKQLLPEAYGILRVGKDGALQAGEASLKLKNLEDVYTLVFLHRVCAAQVQ